MTALLALLLAFQQPIPPPATLDDEGVEVWIGAYLETDGWVVLAADDLAVALGSADGVAVGAEGIVTGLVRHEYYRPSDIGGHVSASNTQVRQVDCVNRRYRVIEMHLYRDNNLGEELASMSRADAQWFDLREGSVIARVSDRMCAAEATGEQVG